MGARRGTFALTVTKQAVNIFRKQENSMYDYNEIQVHIERAKRMRAEALNEIIDRGEAKLTAAAHDLVKRIAGFFHAHGAHGAKQQRLV
jgi:hypothetical protein